MKRFYPARSSGAVPRRVRKARWARRFSAAASLLTLLLLVGVLVTQGYVIKRLHDVQEVASDQTYAQSDDSDARAAAGAAADDALAARNAAEGAEAASFQAKDAADQARDAAEQARDAAQASHY